MAVFRIEKTKNYTVMSNHHLRNPSLSLKAKGLLSQILSLPPEWDYTLKGLSHINRENVDAIRTAIQELERAGYVTRSRERKENGQLGGAEYIIHEQPPTLDAPILENPTQANPTLENPTQLNKDKATTEKLNTDSQNTHSIPIPPQAPQTQTTDRIGTETAVNTNAFNIYREIIHDNIEYPHLLERYEYDHERVHEIIDLMLETVCTSRKIIRIASDDYPAELVKAKFLKLNGCHIEYVLDCLRAFRPRFSRLFPHGMRGYLCRFGKRHDYFHQRTHGYVQRCGIHRAFMFCHDEIGKRCKIGV